MKRNLLFLLMMSGILSLTSCKSGLSDEMKAKMKQLKTDWTVFAADLPAFGDSLKTEYDRMKKKYEKIDNRIVGATMKKNMASYSDARDANKLTMSTMTEEYNAFKKTLSDTTAAFNNWLSKTDSMNVSDDKAKPQYESYKSFLAGSRSKLQQWESSMMTAIENSQKDIDEAIKKLGEVPKPKPKMQVAPSKTH